MAFTGPLVMTAQLMVSVFLMKVFALCEPFDNSKQVIQVFALLFYQFQVPFELTGYLDCIPHKSRAAFRSSTLS